MSILRTKCGKVHLLIKEDGSDNLEIWSDTKIRNEFKFFNLIADFVSTKVESLIEELLYFFNNFGPHGPISNGCM
jgi:hypothetical protein